MRSVSVWTLLAGVALAGAAQAAIIQYDFKLDGRQEVPPNNSPATGEARVILNTDTNALSWNIAYRDLQGTLTAAHFHAPAPPGQNAGVIIPLQIGQNPIIGNAVISDQHEAWILDGLSYANLHTSLFPGGEIRGQVVPEPASALLLLLCGAVALRRSR